ncbi:hypothetical protein P7K49_020090 [Saguinus oedipus]|uniref:Uncharacterized protein n=1 Tax=Saguinus oedipus TaxID=9490 RepID=A0ABQ9UZ80_SAGOE|nr:hypothetical protein P7K49_020090 [Saguinus oedipus]
MKAAAPVCASHCGVSLKKMLCQHNQETVEHPSHGSNKRRSRSLIIEFNEFHSHYPITSLLEF